MTKLKVLELFGGIGACSKALERLGIDYEIADYVEIDKYAVKSFNAMHNTNFEPQDICTWDKDIEVDLIMHGSPCQDFSVAGKGAGGDKDSGTRSSLMYETIRIVEKLKPKYVIWENVKNLLSKKHRHNFDAYLETMEQLGYKNYYQVLNAKDYGIPQNRERVFTISILGNDIYEFPKGNKCNNFIKVIGNYMPSKHDASRIVDESGLAPTVKENHGTVTAVLQRFEFPPKQELKLKLKDMLEDEVDEKYYLTESNIKTINRNFGSKGKILNLDEFSLIEKMTYPSRINQKINETICPTLVSAMGTGGGNVPVINKKNYRLRKLTPKECWRLMGFDDEDFEKAEQVNSNTQLYKQAGNSIVVNVLEVIFKELLK
jgi:DNA (cytosine-5)-methyltransferase 1